MDNTEFDKSIGKILGGIREKREKLEAAAPDLLEALKDLKSTIEILAEKGLTNGNSAAMKRAKAAIKKATI